MGCGTALVLASSLTSSYGAVIGRTGAIMSCASLAGMFGGLMPIYYISYRPFSAEDHSLFHWQLGSYLVSFACQLLLPRLWLQPNVMYGIPAAPQS
eukprot:3546780-Prymnesium_polylepis.1